MLTLISLIKMMLVMVSVASILFLFGLPPSLIYTLSLHDALPISCVVPAANFNGKAIRTVEGHAKNGELSVLQKARRSSDRKSTRLNSSHVEISYAVFCLKKKISRQMTTSTTSINIMGLQAAYANF